MTFVECHTAEDVRQLARAVAAKRGKPIAIYRRPPAEVELRKELNKTKGRAISVAIIIRAACLTFRVQRSELRSKTRKHPLTFIRHACVWIACNHTNRSLPELARLFGRGCHTTIMNSRDLMQRQNHLYQQYVSPILKELARLGYLDNGGQQ